MPKRSMAIFFTNAPLFDHCSAEGQNWQMSAYDDIYTIVSLIPEGNVATYGQIARLAGRVNGARQVGYALAALADEHEVPWHRVVNAQGMVSLRTTPGYEDYQQILLEEEGVEFANNKKINLEKYLWRA